METAAPEVTLEEKPAAPDRAAFWLDQIRLAAKEEEDWRDRAEGVVTRYRDEKRASGSRFNVFYANVELLKPAIFSSTPAPDVRRRQTREDELQQRVGREVAKLLERALSYSIDTGEFDQVAEAVRDDVLLVGRGVARVAYEAEFERREDVLALPMVDPATGAVDNEYFLDGAPVEPEFEGADRRPFVEQLVDERVEVRYVFWSDFRMSPARCWEDVTWIAFRHVMTREQLKDEFGEGGARVPRVLKGDTGEGGREPEDGKGPEDPRSRFARAEVWEIWDKSKRERVWVATGHDAVIRTDPDPLNLLGFFPCPPPLYSVRTTDTMVPLPELTIYQDSADELDAIQERIRDLIGVLKAVAVSDGDFSEIIKIKTAHDGDVIPTERPGVPAASLDASIWWWPVERIIQVIQQLTLRGEQVKQQIYEITGLSDLMRGATHERETARAQQLKAQFGQHRMSPRALPMARYLRDLLRLKAEIMAEMFDPATLERISGMAVMPEMLALMREERLRNTVVEVATDSTIRPDKAAEKEEAIEFMGAVTQYLTAAVPLMAQAPPMAPLLFAILKHTARTMKTGREFEDLIESLVAQVEAAAQQQAVMQQQQAMMAQQMPPAGGDMQPGMMQ